MWCRRHTSRERPDRVRGPASILFLSLIVFAGVQCKRRPAEPAKPATQPVTKRVAKRVTNPVTGFSVEYKEKVNPLEYFPLAVGAKWTYASTYKTGINGSSKSIITIKWITEHVITAEHDIPEGNVFLGKFIPREVRYDYPPDADETHRRWHSDIPFGGGPAGLFCAKNYLITGNYVFGLPDQGATARGLSASYRKQSPWATPKLFFPLDGAHWWSDRVTEERDYQTALLYETGKGHAPNPSTHYWHVDRREDVEVPYGEVRDAVKLTSTGGGIATEWFKEGLGFVKATFISGGSYIEWETTLVDFTPASAAK